MLLFAISLSIFAFDQITKQIVLKSLGAGAVFHAIPGILQLTFVQNEGIAFGFFQEYAPYLFFIIAVSMAGLLIFFIVKPPRHRFDQVAYGFIFGGALGNLMDRIRHGFVVDFLDFYVWPVFNFADSFITIGVCLLILKAFRQSNQKSAQAEKRET